MMFTESTILLAVVGMIGLFSTAIIWQRSNRITNKYYKAKACSQATNRINRDLIELNNRMFN